MKIIYKKGMDALATVYAAAYRDHENYLLEFVESFSGSTDIEEKWVLIVSSQFGCPVGCAMCDTKGYYKGNPTTEELISQIEYLVEQRFPDRKVPTKKFKIQFARMGEPAMNPHVLEAIHQIKQDWDAPGFMPCISTTAPVGTDAFFSELMDLNHSVFHGNFQLQFSIHSTQESQRNKIIPIRKWDFKRIATYGEQFFTGGRKVTLNFALSHENELDTQTIQNYFSPEIFMLKLTPVNPTVQAEKNNMVRENLSESEIPQIPFLQDQGFEVVLSVGDLRENEIGSNCGQLVALWKQSLAHR